METYIQHNAFMAGTGPFPVLSESARTMTPNSAVMDWETSQPDIPIFRPLSQRTADNTPN